MIQSGLRLIEIINFWTQICQKLYITNKEKQDCLEYPLFFKKFVRTQAF